MQALVSAGSKELVSKWDGRGLLKIRVYDFALYANHNDVTANSSTLTAANKVAAPGYATSAKVPDNFPQAPVSTSCGSTDRLQRPRRLLRVLRRPERGQRIRRVGKRDRIVASQGLTDRVRAASDQVEMSLCVRPARDLPLLMLRSEYSRILRKRMHAVGGSPEDPGLRTLLSYFNAAALPAAATRRGCVRRGTVMVFSRSRSGRLRATAAGTPVATVLSPKLCEAVFDLYLGEAPVCARAKAEARTAFEALIGIQHAAVPLAAVPSHRLLLGV